MEEDYRLLLFVAVRLLAVLRAGLLLAAFLRAGLRRVAPRFAPARRFRLVAADFLATAFAAAFLLRVRAAFLAAALRLAFDAAIELLALYLV